MQMFFVIKFSAIISLCSTEFIEYNYETEHFPPTILYSHDENHTAVNEEFRITAVKMGFNVEEVVIDNDILLNTVEASKTFPNVINLKGPKAVTKKDQNRRNVDFANNPSLLCVRNCYNASPVYVSESIMKYRRLWDLITIDINTTTEPTLGIMIPKPKVLVCLPKPNSIDIKELRNTYNDMSLIFKDCNGSTEVDEDWLAVIANELLHGSSNVPTILYQTPYEYPEFKYYFPNSINLSPSWNLLKHGLVSFMKTMHWYRVAVISDDTEYSQRFMEELVPLFVKERIIFSDQRCEEDKCNFRNALETLVDTNARIVIANVDSKNAKRLQEAINHLGISTMTWIVRDWPFGPFQAPWNADIYSLGLFSLYKSDSLELPTAPHFATVTQGLEIIQTVYKRVLADEDMFRRAFVKLGTQIAPKSARTIARVISLIEGRARIVSDMTIDGTGTKAIAVYSTNPKVTSDLAQECIVRGRSFASSCAHGTLLLLVAVLVMFALMMLTTVLYFTTFQRSNYNRFR